MKLGFTGTREGMTDEQRGRVVDFLRQHRPSEQHHGDCIGADAEFHELTHAVLKSDARIIIHPPSNPRLRAYRMVRTALDMRKAAPYLVRNRRIVDETDHLIAAPKSDDEAGGTWFTIKYARKQGKPITIIYPDGSVATD